MAGSMKLPDQNENRSGLTGVRKPVPPWVWVASGVASASHTGRDDGGQESEEPLKGLFHFSSTGEAYFRYFKEITFYCRSVSPAPWLAAALLTMRRSCPELSRVIDGEACGPERVRPWSRGLGGSFLAVVLVFGPGLSHSVASAGLWIADRTLTSHLSIPFSLGPCCVFIFIHVNY